MFHQLALKIGTLPRPTFDYVIVDEAQDVSVGELRFLAALGGGGAESNPAGEKPEGGLANQPSRPCRPNALFFFGDLGQRIFQQPFSWKELASTSAAAPPA